MFIFWGVRNKSGFLLAETVGNASWHLGASPPRLVQRTLAKLGWKSGGTVVVGGFLLGRVDPFFFKATFLAGWWFHIFSEFFRWVEFHQLAFIKDFSVETRGKMGKLNET